MEDYKSSHNVKYDYKKLDSESIRDHIKKLRRKYPNDQEFGRVISQWIEESENPPIFPGIQNL